jgi:GNAT superfamily N-acetyltransferase
MSDRLFEVEPWRDADLSLVVKRGGCTVARASLWWSKTPLLDGRRVGYFGDYFSDDWSAAHCLLAGVERDLHDAGCALAVGPVDGTTWRRYRFVTERGERPPFLLEPDNPDTYPEQLRAAGYAPLAHYISAEESLLGIRDIRAERAAARLRSAGVTVRPFDPTRLAAELDAMYDVACKAFASSLLFSPLDRTAFHQLYAPLREQIDPDFIRIAEHDGRPVGFAFGIVDPSGCAPGEAPHSLVGKTQARLADQRYAGLGAVMLDDVRKRARERGLDRLVHALIREDNIARNASQRTARVFRRYSLFARGIA